MKRFLSITSWAVFAVLLCGIAYGVVTAFALHWKYGMVVSGSMRPTFSEGDMVVTRPVKVDEINVGDIIAFKHGDTSTVHRVVEESNYADGTPYFVTAGDATGDPDQAPVVTSEIQGIYVFSMPRMGYVAAFLGKPYGIAIALGVPLALLILLYWWDSRKKKPMPDYICAANESMAASLPKPEDQGATADGDGLNRI